MNASRVEEHEFEFLGGSLCLDFANTLDRRGTTHPTELLKHYSDLVSWGRQAGVLTDDDVLRLKRCESRNPDEAALTLNRAISFREAIYRIYSDVALQRPPEEADITALNYMLSLDLSRMQLIYREDGFERTREDKSEALDRMLWPVARSAADLLVSKDLGRVRLCEESRCRWLFLDTSRNRSRRWCDMKTCGNRTKARQHRRKKAQVS
jgi:predicted RNA-binding Zn ribbon-like protein